ncbi:MAG: tetratricopeptide repeat protein, partial [Treponemataceae bacterium]|nr:tetratricopeptide repeat protein [Treponemataceae bacterium]
SYTNPIVFFNAGVCYEDIGDFDRAESCYAQAAGSADFLMASHAEFNLGRVREANGNASGAVAAYQHLFDREPDSSWGKLAKTRLIALSSAASDDAE